MLEELNHETYPGNGGPDAGSACISVGAPSK